MSVPWSASKPRRKYCSALPPPWCWLMMRPGTSRRMSAGRPCGRSSKSLPGISISDEADTGGGADTTTGSSTVGGGGLAGDGGSVSGAGLVWAVNERPVSGSDLGASCASAKPALPRSRAVRIARFIVVSYRRRSRNGRAGRLLLEPELDGKKDPGRDGFRALARRVEAPLVNRLRRRAVEVGVTGRRLHDDLADSAVGQDLDAQARGALDPRSPCGGGIAREDLIAAARSRPLRDALGRRAGRWRRPRRPRRQRGDLARRAGWARRRRWSRARRFRRGRSQTVGAGCRHGWPRIT